METPPPTLINPFHVVQGVFSWIPITNTFQNPTLSTKKRKQAAHQISHACAYIPGQHEGPHRETKEERKARVKWAVAKAIKEKKLMAASQQQADNQTRDRKGKAVKAEYATVRLIPSDRESLTSNGSSSRASAEFTDATSITAESERASFEHLHYHNKKESENWLIFHPLEETRPDFGRMLHTHLAAEFNAWNAGMRITEMERRLEPFAYTPEQMDHVQKQLQSGEARKGEELERRLRDAKVTVMPDVREVGKVVYERELVGIEV
ncbi:hypothetical protein YB2330_003909 [Saitoella coloradoensis]